MMRSRIGGRRNRMEDHPRIRRRGLDETVCLGHGLQLRHEIRPDEHAPWDRMLLDPCERRVEIAHTRLVDGDAPVEERDRKACHVGEDASEPAVPATGAVIRELPE